MKIVFSLLFFVSSAIFLLLGILFDNPTVALVAVIIAITHNLIYSIIKLYERIVFLCFNLTFFIFLLGRMVVNKFLGFESSLGIFGLAFNDTAIIFTILICIYLSVLGLYLGYRLIQKVDLSFLKQKKISETSFKKALRKFSFFFFLLTLIFRYYVIFEMMQVSSLEGYYESYSTFTSSLPGLLVLLSNMFDVALFAYLSTNPSRKKSLFPIGLYIIEGLLAAFAGRRSILMLNLLIVFVYFSIRNLRSSANNESKWVGKKEWTFSVIAFPILIVFLNIIGNVRGKIEGSRFSGLWDSILSFMHAQGISANLIGYTKVYKESVPEGKIYVLGPILEFIDNKVIRPFRGLPELYGQSQERALEGYLFAHTISFIIMPVLYLRGVGYGSSFVAELYMDFSYIGVFLGSLIYGFLLFLLFYILRHSNFVLVIFALLATRAIFFAPRAATLSFIVSSLTVSKIAAFIIILIGSKILQILIDNKKIRILS